METLTINLFYPLLFSLIAIIVITIGIVCIKHKDNNLFGNIFNKSSDNAKEITIDTTDKFSKAHSELITCLPKHYEEELHYLEESVKDVQTRMIETTEDINNKLNMILEKVVELEKNNYNNNK